MDASDVIADHTVIPVVVVNDKDKALKLTELFLKTGLNCIEVTLRTENALHCIEAIVKEFPDTKIGAGSVVTSDQLRAAENAGIAFAVSPGASDELLEAATSTYFVPGAATASDIMKLKSSDYRTVKFFPAELLGGIKTIRALSEPIQEIQFFPTGGIRESNLQDYLEFSRIACIGGSWLAPSMDVQNGCWGDIETRCQSLQRILSKN